MFLSSWQFAVAGALCATVPIVIHLLNRRRYRVVQWAAMEFLQEAMKQNRRLIQIRDLLLLLLRIAAVLLFGLALARPYLASGRQQFDGEQPLHAMLLVDNSLSMAYQRVEGSRLDAARQRARELIARLPSGSRVSVIPLCGPNAAVEHDPFTDPERAREVLDRIQAVDRDAPFALAVAAARRAAPTAPDLAPRAVLFTDMQRENFRDLPAFAQDESLPAIQIVDVGGQDFENSWIADIRLQDGVADTRTPATIVVEVAHRGEGSRENVPVTLAVNGEIVASKVVTIDPSAGRREVVFQHQFEARAVEAGKPAFIPIDASLPPDRLPADDRRFHVAPVLAALPVLFVDQYGERDEDPTLNRLGETRHLRRLLAPSTNSSDRPLVDVRHLAIEQLDRDGLSDARLVVVAGVERPGRAAGLLREFVEQGGQLLIAAGGGFDPAAWSAAAWLDGQGILPLPLRATPLGATPEEAGARLTPLSLSFESLGQHPYFRLADVPDETLRDLYAEPFFLKAVDVAADPSIVEALRTTLRQQLAGQFADPDAGQDVAPSSGAGGESASGRDALPLDPDSAAADRDGSVQWLQWDSPTPADHDGTWADDADERARQLDVRVERRLPRVLARLDNDLQSPLLVERDIGRGRVVFFSSGLLSPWNTLPQTNAVVIFDRMLRSMIEATLPQRGFAASERITVALPTANPRTIVTVERPGDRSLFETLNVGFVRRDQLGVDIPAALQRGIYRLQGRDDPASPTGAAGVDVPPAWQVDLAVNGPAAESDWEPLSRAEFDAASVAQLAWIGPTQEISLAGTQLGARDTWWWLVLAVLALLLMELFLLAAPYLSRRATTGNDAATGSTALGGASHQVPVSRGR